MHIPQQIKDLPSLGRRTMSTAPAIIARETADHHEAGRTAPPKRVLALAYSQSGQLTAVLDALLAPLRACGEVHMHVEVLQPEPAYPFPWPVWRFFDAFPESALMRPQGLQPLNLRGDEDFDLVILPYQVWFLAPSLPVSSFLQTPLAARLLAGKPVVTVIVCRNMWLMAQEKMRGLLARVGARLIDNVVLTDPGSMAATLVTTPLWMLTGRKSGWFGLPPAGLSAAQISGAQRFGVALRDALASDAERGSAPLLAGLDAVRADPKLWVSERVATRSFTLWGHLLSAAGRPGAWVRRPLLLLYAMVLLALILTVLPISVLLQALARPLLRSRLAALKTRFEAPSGSGTERLAPDSMANMTTISTPKSTTTGTA